MRPPRWLLLLLLTACAADDAALDVDSPPVDLGDLGDAKADGAVVDRELAIEPGRFRRVTFSAATAFRLRLTQSSTPAGERVTLALSLTVPDTDERATAAGLEPALIRPALDGSYTLTIRNTGDAPATAQLRVRPVAAFDAVLPDPDAPIAPDVDWQPPAVDLWPASYVTFNNPGCGQTCTFAEQGAQAKRSVVVKLMVAAIDGAPAGSVVRISNFNISAANAVKPILDAVARAIARGAEVRVLGDEGQNTPTSRTTKLAAEGVQVRYLVGLRGAGEFPGILHSKLVAVDDRVMFAGSSNFSASGLVTNEENNVVLRDSAAHADRIRSFVCNFDALFAVGVEPGAAQPSDAERGDLARTLAACNSADTWFPPTPAALDEVLAAIAGAAQSIDVSPDLLSNDAILAALETRSAAARDAGEPFAIRVALDGSAEALALPAFGECLADHAARDGLDIQVRYWVGAAAVFQLSHHKFMLVDGDDPARVALYNGSANYSTRAFATSFENVTRYVGPDLRAVTDAFAVRFQRLFDAAQTRAELAARGIEVPACPR